MEGPCQRSTYDVSHSQCLELVSNLSGFKDWNTASAALGSKETQKKLPQQLRTVGEMKQALASINDSVVIDANYEFKLGDFMNAAVPLESPDDLISQEFSLALESSDAEIATFRLTLEHEGLTSTF